jgi:RNA-directed DNA polymerase
MCTSATGKTLLEAYRLAKLNDGAPGIDGVTFEAIEAEGVESFLDQFREEVGSSEHIDLCGYEP